MAERRDVAKVVKGIRQFRYNELVGHDLENVRFLSSLVSESPAFKGLLVNWARKGGRPLNIAVIKRSAFQSYVDDNGVIVIEGSLSNSDLFPGSQENGIAGVLAFL